VQGGSVHWFRAVAWIAWVGAVALAGCGSPVPDEQGPVLGRLAVEDWKIQPGTRVGALSRFGSVLDLAKAYGARNLRDSSIALGEGETESGTLLYADDPQRRIEILWADAPAKQGPKRAILRGERSRWMLPREISLGTSLQELETKNGRPFRLSGFGWDYAGVVTSWEGGTLDRELSPGVKLYLEPRIEDRSGRNYRRLLGDREFPSSDAAMQTLNPRVYQVFVDFVAPQAAGGSRSQ
jgi:hypothetical protein